MDLENESEEEKKEREEWDQVRSFWQNWLPQFKKELYYPVFALHGISVSQAFMIYELSGINSKLRNATIIEEDDGEGEEWNKRA